MGYFIKKCVICIEFSQNDINSLKKKKKISFHSKEMAKKGRKFKYECHRLFVFGGRLDNTITLACIYSQYQ